MSEVLIGENGKWMLFERPGKAATGWRSLHLTCAKRRKKRSWWLAWNGERFAQNRDVKLLAAHEPGIYAWVEGELR